MIPKKLPSLKHYEKPAPQEPDLALVSKDQMRALIAGLVGDPSNLN
jgi:hypothetical protein